MSNMSYCHFRNTLQDLRDCEENLFDKVSPEEASARVSLIQICVGIADTFADEDFALVWDNIESLPVEEQ